MTICNDSIVHNSRRKSSRSCSRKNEWNGHWRNDKHGCFLTTCCSAGSFRSFSRTRLTLVHQRGRFQFLIHSLDFVSIILVRGLEKRGLHGLVVDLVRVLFDQGTVLYWCLSRGQILSDRAGNIWPRERRRRRQHALEHAGRLRASDLGRHVLNCLAQLPPMILQGWCVILKNHSIYVFYGYNTKNM